MDEFDLIETPEHVELEQRLAGIGSRFIAGFVDSVILLAIFLVVVLIFGIGLTAYPFRGVGAWGIAFLVLLWFVIFWGYFVFFEMRMNGQSPGKKAVRIRVVKEGGRPIAFTDIAIRNLLRIVDGFPLILVCAIGGIVMFVTKKCQRLGDLAAGTVVVSEQVGDFSARTDRRVKAAWETEASASALHATGLTPEEYRVLSNYWMRRGQLTLEARRNLLPRLLEPVLQRTGQTLANRRLETLEAYVELLMRQAVFAEADNKGGTTPRRQWP